MNCDRARELMSAFYDQELEPDLEMAVRDHVTHCSECAARLAQFRELSHLAADLRQPDVPAGIWSAIDSSLDARQSEDFQTAPLWRRYASAAIAATLLVGASVALLAYWIRQSADEHHEMNTVFAEYLNRFHQQPEVAQQALLARYQGRLVNPDEAASTAKFAPTAPDELPGGLSRVGTYVLNMPCCTCTQSIYKDDEGHMVALFEHSAEQRGWFGQRPTINATCHGQSTCLVQVGDQLAACWKFGPRYLTVVGARNVEQVAELIAYLDTRRSAAQWNRRRSL